jgi:hypothetical protein
MDLVHVTHGSPRKLPQPNHDVYAMDVHDANVVT